MSEFAPYPPGQLAIGAGELEHVATAKLDAANNAKLMHTLKSSPSGWTKGNNDLSGSFDGFVPSTGEELKLIKLVAQGKKQTFRFKIPGEVFVIVGVLTSVNYTMAAGESTNYSANFIGKIQN